MKGSRAVGSGPQWMEGADGVSSQNGGGEGHVQESILESSAMIPLIHGSAGGSMASYRMTSWEGSFGKLMDLSCPLWKS